jgi:arabinofuranan 3-O-arabinosyltransferase
MKPINTKPKVSIVIPTRNSAQTLSKCLYSVKSQTCKQFETIVVDDLSSDETVRIARDSGAKVLERRCTPAFARNLGVAISSGKYLLFLDSDQVLSPSIVEECVRKCENENVSMIFIPEIFVGKGFWGSCSAVWKNCYSKVRRIHGVGENMLTGEPRFFVKQCFTQAGMFNAAIHWGEDHDLHKRMKALNVKEDLAKSSLYHYEPSTLKKILFKLFRYGQSMPTFARGSETQILRDMPTNSLLTLKEVYKLNTRYPIVIVGCTFLLWLKTCYLAAGLLTGYDFERGVGH